MKRIVMLGLLAFAVAAGTGFGCYTMIRHPMTDMATDDAGDRSCADCHADADAYHWTEPYPNQLYSDYPTTWGTYYLHPWWYDKSWGPGASGAGATVEQGGRHAWDRGPGGPEVPSVGGTQGTVSSGAKPATANPSPAREAKDRDKGKDKLNNNDQDNGNAQDSDKDRDKDKDSDKDKTKDEKNDDKRNAWGR